MFVHTNNESMLYMNNSFCSSLHFSTYPIQVPNYNTWIYARLVNFKIRHWIIIIKCIQLIYLSYFWILLNFFANTCNKILIFPSVCSLFVYSVTCIYMSEIESDYTLHSYCGNITAWPYIPTICGHILVLIHMFLLTSCILVSSNYCPTLMKPRLLWGCNRHFHCLWKSFEFSRGKWHKTFRQKLSLSQLFWLGVLCCLPGCT